MRRLITSVAILSVTALTGCASVTASEGDKQACTVWSEAQQAMVQTVAIIYEMAKDPASLTEEVVTEFNTKRNQLLGAYDQAKALATSDSLKSALEVGLDADSIVYYDLAGATDARIQDSLTAVGNLVVACTAAGIDVSDVLGTK
jgi:hypothetical protein